MSSLHSRIRKHNGFTYESTLETNIVSWVDDVMRLFPPTLVNIDDYVWNMDDQTRQLSLKNTDMTPCRRSLWLEWMHRQKGLRIAHFVLRLDPKKALFEESYPFKNQVEESRHLVVIAGFHESNGHTHLWSVEHVYLDDNGVPFGKIPYYGNEEYRARAEAGVFLLGDVLTSMNTRGTRIEPPFSKAPAQVVKPNRAPCSVWHTIHIPKFRREPLGLPTADEVVEKREHWVRAHRADYREGKGLFGRIHGLIWIPEHKRGNPDLGTVQSSYEVHT